MKNKECEFHHVSEYAVYLFNLLDHSLFFKGVAHFYLTLLDIEVKASKTHIERQDFRTQLHKIF